MGSRGGGGGGERGAKRGCGERGRDGRRERERGRQKKGVERPGRTRRIHHEVAMREQPQGHLWTRGRPPVPEVEVEVRRHPASHTGQDTNSGPDCSARAVNH